MIPFRTTEENAKNVEFNHDFIVWCMCDGALNSPRWHGQEDGDFVHTLVVSVRFFFIDLVLKAPYYPKFTLPQFSNSNLCL